MIAALHNGVPKPLSELVTLGSTLNRCAEDVLASLDRPGTPATARPKRSTADSSISVEALGFRNLANYITRALLDTGGFRPRLHPLLR